MKRLLGKTASMVCCMAVGLGSLSVARADEKAREVLDKVKKKYEAIVDAQLRFTQRTMFSVSKVEQRVSGTLLLKKENKYRVETEDQTIVTDGITVWSYRPATKQALIDNFKMDERSLSPERILTGAPKDFTPTYIGDDKVGKSDAVLIKLLPGDRESLVKWLKLWIDEDTWLIRQVELLDINGKQTVYTISDIKTNGGIPASRFTFEIPAGVESVDLR